MDLSWLRGVFPPIPTPFTNDGSVATPVQAFLEHLRDGGLDGVVALGSNGEAPQLTDTERTAWIGAIRASLPAPLRLIAGTGADSTRATIERTRAAAAVGAEAVLVLAPMYFRRDMTLEAVRAHYHSVADASPIPVLIYNVPVFMGWDIPDAWIPAIAEHPNVRGLKDSSGRTERLVGLRSAVGPGFVLLAGAGDKMVDAIASGADGAIAALANVAPAACATIRREMVAGRIEVARARQAEVAPVGEALGRTAGVARLKAALRLQGYDHGDPRAPVPRLPDSELPALRRLLEAAQLLPSALPA
ncbi:MAG: dihydrodipicolinate synthase family protein [Candidatus Dormibacteraeota bacterium]|nr:dihydrodipicolinate synthase family protein [Candidatus Dormibacteraeota bacterium]